MTRRVLSRVLGELRYAVLASVIMFIILSSLLLLPNLGVITQVFGISSLSVGTKLLFVASLYGTLWTNFTFFSALNLFLLAILSGINIALLVYYIRRQQIVSKNTAVHLTSLGGIVSGLFGIGCAACGSIIATALLGAFGAGGLLILLPLHGIEFGLLGIVLLVVSIRYLLRKIDDPLICRVG